MSAPNTDPKKQAKRHKGPLGGIAGVVTWALVLLVLLSIFVAYRANTPGNEQPIEADQAEALGEGETAGTAEGGVAAEEVE